MEKIIFSILVVNFEEVWTERGDWWLDPMLAHS